MFRRLAQLKKAGGKLSRRLPGSFENGKPAMNWTMPL
jgi:hypothetical protein